jgi:hypothetical protein
MAAHRTSFVGGIVLILISSGGLRAEETLDPSSPATGLTSQQPSARGAKLFWLFGRPTYASSTTSISTTTVPGVASTTTAAVTAIRTVRPQDSQQPSISSSSRPVQSQPSASAASTQLSGSVFGDSAVATSQLSQQRRSRASGNNSDVVSGRESNVRATTDAGSLLGKSSSARGVSTQQRTPIMTDTRIRGSGVGRMVASGG